MAKRYATKAEVLALATELTDEAPLDVIVEMTQSMVNLETWGSKASVAHQALAAHFATEVMNPAGATGPVASRTIDKLAESYAVTAPSDAELGTTKYGRLYLMLRKGLLVVPFSA